MLRRSYITKAITAAGMGHDIAEAASLGLPEDRRQDFIILHEGMFGNIVKEVLEYQNMLSGGNRNTAIAETQSIAESMGDAIAEDLSVADLLPSTPAEIPADRSGLTGLLQLADRQPKSFDTGKVEGWYNALAASDEAIPQVREEMVQSGLFSSEQRMSVFSEKLQDTYNMWQDNVVRELTDRATKAAGKSEVKEQNERLRAEEQARIADLVGDVSIADIKDPAMRAKVEQRQAEIAKAQIAEQEKFMEQDRRQSEFAESVSKPSAITPGLDAYLEDIKRQLTPDSNDPEDIAMQQRVVEFSNELRGAVAATPEIPWETASAVIMKQYPDLLDLATALQADVDQGKYERERGTLDQQEIRPPHKRPDQTVPESQKADELPEGITTSSALIKKNEEFDKTKGPWEIDLEAKALRRRKVMVANALLGRPPLPYTVGDSVAFSRGSSLDCGSIVDITATHYVVKAKNDQVEIAHEAVFEPAIKELF